VKENYESSINAEFVAFCSLLFTNHKKGKALLSQLVPLVHAFRGEISIVKNISKTMEGKRMRRERMGEGNRLPCGSGSHNE
jgi:hypothetical protein